MTENDWIPIQPTFPDGSDAAELLTDFARELAALRAFETDKERNVAIEACRRRMLKGRNKCDALGRQFLVAAVHVLADLMKQGWDVRVVGDTIEACRQDRSSTVGDDARDHVRGQLHAERDEQLRQPATKAFVRSMAARQLFNDRFTSIFSVMRDGRELAVRLQEVRDASTEVEQVEFAGRSNMPYLQFVRGEDDRCEWSGLRLMDIWRYFQNTWASSHKSVPGRTIMVLVRDATAPCHSVISIAALSSAAVAVTVRDHEIGWTAARVIEEIRNSPTAKYAA